MSCAPDPRASTAKLMCRPGCPASPNDSAYSDHRYAAVTPIEISVSIVAAPGRGDGAGEVHPRRLGGEVDRRGDPGQLVQLLLDPRRARGAGHPADRKL